jgi:hypothetical protein
MEQAKYIPGVCNIGPQEGKLRRMAGWIGVGAFSVLFVFFRWAGFAKGAAFFLFIPALLGSIGLLQYYQRFCVNFGLRGLMNVDKEAFKTDKVGDPESRRLDRQKSWKIIALGTVISLAATLAAYFF